MSETTSLIEALALKGRVKKNVTSVIDGFDFEMHTLNSLEDSLVTKSTELSRDNAVKYDVAKKTTLIYAIDKVNQKQLTFEEKKNLVDALQTIAVEKLYQEYLIMLGESEESLSSVKKN